MNITSTSLRRHRPRAARIVLGALVASLLTVLVPMSSPASALGYRIEYSMWNDTQLTLTLERARIGAQVDCFVFGTAYSCVDTRGGGRDYSSNVSPISAAPGDRVVIVSELDWFKLRQADNIDVVYDIPGRGKVHLHSNPDRDTCTVTGTKSFTCVNLGLRQWALRPAA